MNITFDEASHSYTLDGRPVPGVTSILDPMYDFRFVDPAAMEAARDFGTKVHRTVELSELGALNRKSLAPELEARLVQWERFKHDMGYLPAGGEVRVGSRKYSYCGTLDNHGLLLAQTEADPPERSLLLDLKTGAEYPAHKLQTAGYWIAAVEMGLLPDSTIRASVYLDEDGYRFRFHPHRQDIPTFLSLLTIAHWKAHYGK